jgi:steroid delta-isomerase-like uncharacterized protein
MSETNGVRARCSWALKRRRAVIQPAPKRERKHALGNREIVQKLFIDLFSKGNLPVAEEIIAANHVNHDPATPHFGKGPDGERQIVTLYRNAFPDLQFTIERIIDVGDFVAVRFRATATHKGALRGITATNKAIKVEGEAIYRISSGKVAESWVYWDALGLMQQLGQFPKLEMVKSQAAR